MDDPWEGFWFYLERFCELQAGDRAFNDLAATRLPTDARTGHERLRAFRLARQIFRRAQRHGSVRADVTPEDLAFLIWSQAGIIQATRDVAPNAWRHHLHLMLDAFRAERAHPLPGPPLTPRQVEQTLTTLCGPSDPDHANPRGDFAARARSGIR
jgi:hypothetical protein